MKTERGEVVIGSDVCRQTSLALLPMVLDLWFAPTASAQSASALPATPRRNPASFAEHAAAGNAGPRGEQHASRPKQSSQHVYSDSVEHTRNTARTHPIRTRPFLSIAVHGGRRECRQAHGDIFGALRS